MKFSFSALILTILLFSSCQEDPKTRALKQEKEAERQEIIFNNINNGWNFNTHLINETSRSLTNNWTEWRVFINVLSHKPKTSLYAFQQKAKTLAKTARELNNNIPLDYDLPDVRSRIAVIITLMDDLDLYIHLNEVPDKKIVPLIKDINLELVAFQKQLAEIVQKKNIKKEEGEDDLLKMRDTTRAIPTMPIENPKTNQVP